MQQTYETARQLQQFGDFQKAESIYRQLINNDPGDIRTLNALGKLLLQNGRSEEALTIFQTAIDVDKKVAESHLNLGEALRLSGRLSEAEVSIQRAIKRRPQDPEANFCLGKLYHDLGNLEEAIRLYKRTLQWRPVLLEACIKYAQALCQMGHIEEAVVLYDYSLSINPKSLDAHLGLADIYFEQQQLAKAENHYRQCLKLDTDNAHVCRGLVLSIWNMTHVNPTEIESLIQQIERLDPEAAASQYIKGVWNIRSGKSNEGRQQLLQSIKQSPNAEAIFEYCTDTKFVEANTFIERLCQRLITESPINHGLIATLEFAMGKMYDDIKDYPTAFEHYRSGNNHARAVITHDLQQEKSQFATLTKFFTREFFQKNSIENSASEGLVFIVGMPKSGTTITEQILASHPLVLGAGELAGISGIENLLTSKYGKGLSYPELLNGIDKHALQGISQAFIAETSRLFPGNHSMITDKMPHNFLRLGLIALLLPKAKIIHVKRDAMDNCLSIYFQLFSSRWHSYAYDLTDIGNHYLQYQKLMSHWKAVLPISMLDVNYEDLVSNPEKFAKQLVSFCGLPWDDRCLSPNQGERIVRTSSSQQIRQPIYKTSMARWKNYEQHLLPLKTVLGSAAI